MVRLGSSQTSCTSYDVGVSSSLASIVMPCLISRKAEIRELRIDDLVVPYHSIALRLIILILLA